MQSSGGLNTANVTQENSAQYRKNCGWPFWGGVPASIWTVALPSNAHLSAGQFRGSHARDASARKQHGIRTASQTALSSERGERLRTEAVQGGKYSKSLILLDK